MFPVATRRKQGFETERKFDATLADIYWIFRELNGTTMPHKFRIVRKRLPVWEFEHFRGPVPLQCSPVCTFLGLYSPLCLHPNCFQTWDPNLSPTHHIVHLGLGLAVRDVRCLQLGFHESRQSRLIGNAFRKSWGWPHRQPCGRTFRTKLVLVGCLEQLVVLGDLVLAPSIQAFLRRCIRTHKADILHFSIVFGLDYLFLGDMEVETICQRSDDGLCLHHAHSSACGQLCALCSRMLGKKETRRILPNVVWAGGAVKWACLAYGYHRDTDLDTSGLPTLWFAQVQWWLWSSISSGQLRNLMAGKDFWLRCSWSAIPLTTLPAWKPFGVGWHKVRKMRCLHRVWAASWTCPALDWNLPWCKHYEGGRQWPWSWILQSIQARWQIWWLISSESSLSLTKSLGTVAFHNFFLTSWLCLMGSLPSWLCFLIITQKGQVPLAMSLFNPFWLGMGKSAGLGFGDFTWACCNAGHHITRQLSDCQPIGQAPAGEGHGGRTGALSKQRGLGLVCTPFSSSFFGVAPFFSPLSCLFSVSTTSSPSWVCLFFFLCFFCFFFSFCSSCSSSSFLFFCFFFSFFCVLPFLFFRSASYFSFLYQHYIYLCFSPPNHAECAH